MNERVYKEPSKNHIKYISLFTTSKRQRSLNIIRTSYMKLNMLCIAISFELWACMACRLGLVGSINRCFLLFALFFALFFLRSFFSMGTVVHVGIVGQIVLSTWVWFVFFDPKMGLIY